MRRARVGTMQALGRDSATQYFWLGCFLSMLWMFFFLGEAIEGMMRGDVDVTGLALVGTGVIWCLGSGVRHVMTARISTNAS